MPWNCRLLVGLCVLTSCRSELAEQLQQEQALETDESGEAPSDEVSEDAVASTDGGVSVVEPWGETYCADEIVGADEGCDDGAESARCNSDCTPAECGDGVLNLEAGEACDDGAESARCNSDCTPAECGDGVLNLEAGEECDDAGESAVCNDDCSLAGCGDGILNRSAGELCDEGEATTACSAECGPASCGDSVLDSEAGEQCDDGGESEGCNSNCTTSRCGDGLLNRVSGEECDEGAETTDCNEDCSLAECGDGVVNTTAGEECDDGQPSADCDANCTPAECGDGVVNPAAGEECDASGESSDCDLDCSEQVCGDGLVNLSAGEVCEPPGVGNCASDCQLVSDVVLVTDETPGLEVAIQERLEMLGMTVTSLDQEAVTLADADQSGLVVVTKAADGGLLGSALVGTRAPLMLLEESVWHAHGFGSQTRVTSGTMMSVVEQHPMVAGLSGDVTLWSSDRGYPGLEPLDSTLVLGRASSNADAVWLFAYEAGALLDGMVAGARGVGFVGGHHPSSMTDDSWAIFDASVRWLRAAPVPDYGSCEELFVNHPALPEGLYMVGGLPANCD